MFRRIAALLRTPRTLADHVARAESYSFGRMTRLYFGVRHLHRSQKSYWWLDACTGQTVNPAMRCEFEDTAEVQAIWDEARAESERRGIPPPYIDEWFWRSTCEIGNLDACLKDARETLAGAAKEMTAFAWEDDRTPAHGYRLELAFEGRPHADRLARAILYDGLGAPKEREAIRCWAEPAAARLGVPLTFRDS